MSAFQRALERLKQFNRFVLETPELRAWFVDGDYNFLQAYQVFLFLDFVNASGMHWGAAPAGEDGAAPLRVRLRQLFALAWSLGSYLWIVASRRRVLFYSPDRETHRAYHCDFRISNLYRCLFEQNAGFAEIFHTIFDEQLAGRALLRRRAVLYLETIDVLYKLGRALRLADVRPAPQAPVISGEEAKLFGALVATYAERVNQSRFRIRVLRRLLKMTNIQVAIGSADMRYYQEIYAACGELGIKTYGFQSGNISKYNVEYLDYGAAQSTVIKPSVLLMESGFWKRELLRWGTYYAPDEVRVGGNIKEDYHPASPAPRRVGQDITVLVPYEIIAAKEEVLAYVKKLLPLPGVSVVFKFRPDRDLASQVRDYGLGGLPGNFKAVTNLSEIDGFDVVAGCYSSFLYEMIGALKPVAMLKTSLDWGESLIVNDLAKEISLDDPGLLQALKDIAHTDQATLQRRREKLFGEVVPLAETLGSLLGF